MRRIKRTVILLLIFTVIFQINSFNMLTAADTQTPPSMLRVDPKDPGEPAIGYNEFDQYYVDLKWDITYPSSAISGYVNFYTQEIAKPYKGGGARSLKDRDVSGNHISGNTYAHRLKGLKSGTVYYIDATAYYNFVFNDTTYSSPQSGTSNRVKVLTNINVSAYALEGNKIKIEWDDVWNTGGRIDYKLYISENSSFSNTPPIYIKKGQIGANGPVTVNEETGKLEYIHTARDPGRVYYVRIEPDVTDIELKKNQYSNTVTVSSFILVKTTKISTDDSGAVWKLDWSPVVTGLGDSDIKITYHIYKGEVNSSALPQYMAAVDGTSFFVTLPTGNVENYFIIRALVTRNGQDVYEGIKIESEQVIVTEQEVAFYPAVPEIVDEFTDPEGEIIASFGEKLEPRSATVMWRVPLLGDGQIDENVVYDIWLIEDPDQIDNPPQGMLIASDIKIGSGNYILYDNKILGYSYKLSNLTPNSTYYFKIVAKREFLEYVDNILQKVTYRSGPAIKVIVTPPEGPINQPNVPARPPLKVKVYGDGRDSITQDSVIIQLKNLWYEKYNAEEKRWEYIRTEKLSETDIPPYVPVAVSSPSTDPGSNSIPIVVDDVYYRKVSYDSGVKIDVGCIKFTEGMTYDGLKNIAADWITGFPVEPNDPLENPQFNPDNNKHNVDIPVTGLEPNTAYVIWVRATRPELNLVSEPSDPIIITTDPVIIPPPEKPVVPFFNYSLSGDTYIDLGWEFKPEYNYYIKYGTEDNINSAVGNVKVVLEDLYNSMYYRVRDLKPGTLYYFWLQAESVSGGESIKSEWSDSYLVSTLELIPPDSPRGFGIKNSSDAVTKNSITFEWIQEEGLQYILEVSKDMNFSESKEYNVGAASEYTVDGLLSNHRYFARLFAYDPAKDLRSGPTHVISVRTLGSRDDYDSDVDIEDAITGEYIEKAETIEDGVWNIRIVGVNADRFIEQVIKDNKLDVTIDLSNPPAAYKKLRILASDKVFKSLTTLSENLIIKTEKLSLVIRPGMITTDNFNPLAGKASGVDYEICIFYPDNVDFKLKNMVLKTKVARIEIGVVDGGNVLPVKSLLKPLRVLVKYDDEYREGKISGFVYEKGTSAWRSLNTSYIYNYDTGIGTVAYETIKTGDTVVAETGFDYYDDIYYHNYESAINNVASVHELKSIPGRLFEPDNYATLGSTVKIMFDVLKYEYGSDYMKQAARAGLISAENVGGADRNCTVGEAYKMLVRLFELKTGSTLDAKSKSEFIEVNGLELIRDNKKTVPVNDSIKRGELLALIEKILVYIGELE